MKSDVVLKQFSVNILIPLTNDHYIIKENDFNYAECVQKQQQERLECWLKLLSDVHELVSVQLYMLSVTI